MPKGNVLYLGKVLYQGCHFTIIFKDSYVWLFKSSGKNGVSLCNLPLPLWLESSLSRQCHRCVVSVSTQRGACVCLCVCACMFTTLWLDLLCVRQLHSEHQYMCVYIYIYRCWCVINSTAVFCFSPWGAAGTSWSSGQVWWVGRWAAACGPAAAATPDSEDRHNTTPFKMTATAQITAANSPYNPTKTIYYSDYTVCLLVLCLLSTKRNWL